MVYAIAFILQTVLHIEFEITILIISVITVIYSWQGGMKAVVWGDTIQMVISIPGINSLSVFWLGFASKLTVDSPDEIDPARLQVINTNWGLQRGSGIWFVANGDRWLLSIRFLLRL